jgi:hypothetical protein
VFQKVFYAAIDVKRKAIVKEGECFVLAAVSRRLGLAETSENCLAEYDFLWFISFLKRNEHHCYSIFVNHY